MTCTQAMEKYVRRHGLINQHRAVFAYFDEKELSLDRVTAKDVSDFFMRTRLSKKSQANVRWLIKQVLKEENINTDWLSDVVSPPADYYLTIEEILRVIDGYAHSVPGVDPSGFDTVKACVILAWLGLSADEMNNMKMKDLSGGEIKLPDRVVAVEDSSLREFLERYSESEGYIFYQEEKEYRKGNERFLPFLEPEYFLRSVRPIKNRDRFCYTLFLRIKDLGIKMSDVHRAGMFDRAYRLEKAGERTGLKGTAASEYKDYKAQRLLTEQRADG